MYPKKLTFKEPPFGIVTIQKGQFGYLKKTNTRLGRDKDGKIYFIINANSGKDKLKYVEDDKNNCVFNLKI